ncbi:hypothetical protein THAOC_33055 [Thalassiosira oceanica]|uniref:Uncharacterized protein n=1 Tax=Thalassiosira oceanica TaxID=159749 RepID=K0R7Z0_THAOC|nr:hypothetical protein THAOC_33055 [Thalassiosira oceanica]|eukprot:EJK48174.1 hypothetical protein THAOC_33055 [Thalassiosira oceanica]
MGDVIPEEELNHLLVGAGSIGYLRVGEQILEAGGAAFVKSNVAQPNDYTGGTWRTGGLHLLDHELDHYFGTASAFSCRLDLRLAAKVRVGALVRLVAELWRSPCSTPRTVATWDTISRFDIRHRRSWDAETDKTVVPKVMEHEHDEKQQCAFAQLEQSVDIQTRVQGILEEEDYDLSDSYDY